MFVEYCVMIKSFIATKTKPKMKRAVIFLLSAICVYYDISSNVKTMKNDYGDPLAEGGGI
jgi:hypothetical protein